MLKQALVGLVFTASLAGCLVEHPQRSVAPRYVAQCPAGYRYDGHDCHRNEPPPAAIVVQVR